MRSGQPTGGTEAATSNRTVGTMTVTIRNGCLTSSPSTLARSDLVAADGRPTPRPSTACGLADGQNPVVDVTAESLDQV
ncbi:MAG: hypothetical protein ABI083_10960 [Lapillicoccus sp.]